MPAFGEIADEDRAAFLMHDLAEFRRRVIAEERAIQEGFRQMAEAAAKTDEALRSIPSDLTDDPL